MLLDLLKFVIRTRFSRPFLILIVVLVVYSFGISSLVTAQNESTILTYYGTAIIALFLGMALATGGIMVLKSDRDYLFTLPISTRDLSVSIFFSQFIAYGTSILFMFLYLAQSLSSILLIVDLVALALVFTSLGVISPSLTTRARLSLAVLLAVWTLAAFANFPISPGAAFNGNAFAGTATLLALAGVTTPLAFRSLSHIELDMMKSLVRSTAQEIKSPNSYAGKSPLGAIYSMNLSTISLAGRMNMAGTSRYVSKRIRTRWVLTATLLAAAAYLGAVLYIERAEPLGPGTNALPATIISAVLLTFFAFFLSQSAITNERLWLSLTSLPPATYFRHFILSRLLSLLVIVAPFAVADSVLYALGYAEAVGAVLVILLIIPGSFILEILWAAYIAPVQVKSEDMTMPAQFSLRQLATVVPLIPTFVLASAASAIPEIALIGGAILIACSALLMASNRFWGKVVTRLTENGFI